MAWKKILFSRAFGVGILALCTAFTLYCAAGRQTAVPTDARTQSAAQQTQPLPAPDPQPAPPAPAPEPEPEPEPEPAVTLPAERVETGTAGANAPSDGGWQGASDEELLAFLEELAALPHYKRVRAPRYLNYYGSHWTNEQILRIVNTDNDLLPFEQAWNADVGRGSLILANKYHYLDRYEPPELVQLSARYGTWGALQREAYDAFVAMVDAAEAAGYRIQTSSPYRSYAIQRDLYAAYADRNGAARADTYSARAGYSEHQLGLAVDVCQVGGYYGAFGSTPDAGWVNEHAHEYGFILRYGEDMTYITGYIYEPWHFRYVGPDAAAYIRDNGLTYEEYYYYYVAGDETR